ncbi:peptidoglycan recognition protein family protein [Streptomyces longwoodensis]|uniref:peptidoglycan recognition protein family protein n=1 Tax=Streptomyces longwoodensis TaxID=68231 RepID=UPI00382E8C44
MKLVTRAQLGWPASAAPDQASTRGVKVHYEGTPVSARLLDDHSACIAEWKAIRASHLANTQENYSDIAYNYGACPHGYLLEGRGIGKRTGANGNQELNRAHYAIVGLVGTEGVTRPTDAMLGAIRDGIELLRKHGAGTEIKGHRDGYATACPGPALYAWVQSGAPRPASTEPTQPSTTPTPSTPPAAEESDMPTMLDESNPRDVVLPSGEWVGLAFADAVIHSGPRLHDTLVHVTLDAQDDALVEGRFYLTDTEGANPSAYQVITHFGGGGHQFALSGKVPADRHLRFQLRVTTPNGTSTTLLHRTATGPYWVA